MKKIVLTAFICSVMLSSDFGHAFLFFGGGNQPVASELAMIYFPFPDQPPEGWEALPTTNGLWTRERMLRDIRRLKAARVSFILFALTPERLSPPSPYFVEDCQAFLQLCKTANIAVFPMISASKIIPRRDQSVIVQYIQDVWNKKDSEASQLGRTPCFLAGEAVNWRLRNPAVQFVNIPASTPSKTVTINDKTWLFAAVPGQTPSAASARNREKGLDDTLKELSKRSAPVSVLCLSAWNNYGNSHVIEPNTIDGNALYERLSKWAEKHIAKP